jgi:hypothetical protein
MLSSSPLYKKPSVWRPGCKPHRYRSADQDNTHISLLMDSWGEAKRRMSEP